MDRRRFLCASMAALLGSPLRAEAQRSARVRRIGFLTWLACPNEQSVFAVALRGLGYVWGRTIQVACRSGEGGHARLMDAAAGLAGQNVEVIAALTHTAAYAAHRATRSIPIVMIAEARRIADLAARHRLPAMYWAKWFVDAGGLAAYSADYDDLVRRAAHYVDRILKGARPAELPIEQPTKFEFVVNMKTAKALGLTIAPSLLLRADHIVE